METGDPVEKRMPCASGCLRLRSTPSGSWKISTTSTGPRVSRPCNASGSARARGADVDFMVVGSGDVFTVFTTRPDTLFGATYCVFAPEHPLVKKNHHRRPAGRGRGLRGCGVQEERPGPHAGGQGKDTAYSPAPLPLIPSMARMCPSGFQTTCSRSTVTAPSWPFPPTTHGTMNSPRLLTLPIVEVISGGDVSQEAFTGNGTLVNSSFIDRYGRAQGQADHD